MTPIRKWCACRAWPAGSLVLFAGETFRAVRDAGKYESPTAAPEAWERFDPRGAMTPPSNSMTAAPR